MGKSGPLLSAITVLKDFEYNVNNHPNITCAVQCWNTASPGNLFASLRKARALQDVLLQEAPGIGGKGCACL